MDIFLLLRHKAHPDIMRLLDTRMLLIGAFSLFVATGLSACGEPTIDEEEAADYAEGWMSSVEEYLRSEAVLAAGSEALQVQLSNALQREESQVQLDGPPFARLVDEVYAGFGYEPRLMSEQGLTPQGEAIWQALQHVEDHNLDAEPYRLESIAEYIEEWESRRDSVADFEALQATDEDRQQAISWLVEQPVSAFELTSSNHDVLTSNLVDDQSMGERLRKSLKDYQNKQSSIAEAAASVEYLLASGIVRYARQQRHFRIKDIFVHPRHWDYYNEGDVEDSGRRPDPERGAFLAGRIWRDAAHLTEEIADENEVELLHGFISETLIEIIESDDPAREINLIPPQHPNYSGLVAEYRRYRDIVDSGGWEEVPRRDNLSVGQSHEVVSQLKERLRREDYFPDDVEITDTYDEELEEAIRAYQKTHQMAVTGQPHRVFWFSLNLSAERRMAQIALNMNRWRESNVRHELGTYSFVNIPDFTIELWHEHERIMHFATIVGDNEESINPLTDEEEFSNRTPTPMAAYIDRVVFNPYWNVTKRIRAVRILPDVRESIERKYALKFATLLDEAQGVGEETPEVEEEGSLAAIRSSMRVPGMGRAGSTEAQQTSDIDEEDVEEMSEEEREELEKKLRTEALDQAFKEWTTLERIYDEEHERYENKRFLLTSKLRNLEAELFGDDTEAIEEFQAQYPYLDWETGEVDVENTDPDAIPAWYEQNGYEVVHPGHEVWEYVRMLPGDNNSLGFVKIIFPNYNNIYLHDTPGRSLFNRQIRGFSHGCIRLHRPMEMSQALLDIDGNDANIDDILESEEYLPIFLDRQIPIYLEYYTVSIDDDGRANFLADIYDYDDEELDELVQ